MNNSLIYKVSIILPVYNVESYLEECLGSITSQTFTEWECICVDDGSTDLSLFILKRWAEKDNRFKVISQENRGLSGARMSGFLQSGFDIISFVDSDDQLKPDFLEKMVYNIVEYNLDVCGCAYETFPDGKWKKFEFAINKVLSFEELMRSSHSIQKSNDLCFVWRYMFRRDFLIQHKFSFDSRVRIGEDMIFMTEVIAHAQHIMLTDEPLYLYRTNNPNSLMHYPKFNPYMDESYRIMYETKYRQCQKYHIDDFTPYSRELAETCILQYIPTLMKNRRTHGEDSAQYIREVLSMPFVQHAMKRVGWRNIYPSWREYLVYLAMKLRIISVLKRYF